MNYIHELGEVIQKLHGAKAKKAYAWAHDIDDPQRPGDMSPSCTFPR